MTQTICFIGGGNMAQSLIGGLIHNGYDNQHIIVSDPDSSRLQQLAELYSVRTSEDNLPAVEAADVLVLAVKPQVLAQVCQQLQPAVQQKQPLIISIAAGIRSTDIERWLGGNLPVVRTMPNTPSLIQAGATGLYANAATSSEQKTIAEQILKAAGLTLWVEKEDLLDAVTALSGSGPAYYFLIMQAMQRAGEKLGLDAHSADLLARQTALGAARMATEGEDDPATLRAKVTSKGGTTAAAIASFEASQLDDIILRALTAARDRATELADELGRQ
jgi:pyrroline-5-carboxylate reductase